MRTIVLLGLGLLAASPALAHKDKEESAAGRDPNKIVCKNEEVIGSRLASKKTCMTAMQWDQLRREQRDVIDRVQAYKPRNGE